MTRIAILDDYQNVSRRLVDWSPVAGRAEPVVFNEHLGGADAVAAALAGFPVIVAMRERTPFPAGLLGQLPDLKLLVTTGMRNFAIDMEAAKACGITVCGTELLPYPAAELTWGLIMSLSLGIPDHIRGMAEAGWQTGVGQSLYGRTLGIIGLGKQGKQVARFARAFHMDVLAWSRSLTQQLASEHDAQRVELDELLTASDIVTIHVVLNEGTRGLIGERELGLMRPDALLVNTARGPIVDEAALLGALKAGRIAGAALDVYGAEPLPRDHPLRSAPNTLLSPHMGYVTTENLTLMYTQAVEDIEAWLNGKPVRVLNG